MRVLLTTFNSSYIHKNLALRWLYVAKPKNIFAEIKEYTIKDKIANVIEYIKNNNFNVVAISTYIWNVKETKQLIKEISSLDKEIKVVLGGPEVTYENDEWFELDINGIVLGEGERVFWDYLLKGDDSFVKVKAKEFKPIKKEDLNFLESLQSPYNLDFDHQNMENQYLYIEASRGCPFRCSYCLSSLDNQVRLFSLDYLEKIFDQVKNHKINQVKFLDRTFNAQRIRTKKLYKMLEKYSNVESFQVEIVADRLSLDQIEMIIAPQNRHRYRYEVGIQSFNQKTLKSVDRSQNNELLKSIIHKLLKNDVVVHADLIAGLPYEGLESFKDSFNQLAKLYPSELQLGILKLLKGTKMKRDALNFGYLANSQPPYEVYKTPWLNKEEMNEINLVAKGVDRTLNRGLFSNIVKYLNNQIYKDNFFALFYDFGLIFDKIGISYQKHQLFMEVYNRFFKKLDDKTFLTHLNIDYFRNEKQKPKQLFKEIRAKTFNRRIVDGGYFNQEQVYRYSRVFKDYRVKDGCVLVLFNKYQKPANLYAIDFKEHTCQKI